MKTSPSAYKYVVLRSLRVQVTFQSPFPLLAYLCQVKLTLGWIQRRRINESNFLWISKLGNFKRLKHSFEYLMQLSMNDHLNNLQAGRQSSNSLSCINAVHMMINKRRIDKYLDRHPAPAPSIRHWVNGASLPSVTRCVAKWKKDGCSGVVCVNYKLSARLSHHSILLRCVASHAEHYIIVRGAEVHANARPQ